MDVNGVYPALRLDPKFGARMGTIGVFPASLSESSPMSCFKVAQYSSPPTRVPTLRIYKSTT
ncbi:hypothetical protein TIFTF001_009580 [Ficus carica]|uniref:Uncharacterized protein n=1 Tax=Ficus carica TaxID=3494 RepID=A0AA87ZUW3_FICCA|nr:hypothetical protein TIFTF001_009580 [Ficus carica]